MRRPLGTSGGTITAAPMVLIDLETEEGVPGHAYLFGYSDVGARTLRQLLSGISEMVRGDAVAPVAIAKKLHARFTLIGREGLPTIAMSGLDVALWDAVARATGLPLARLLGGELHPVPAYNSNALGLETRPRRSRRRRWSSWRKVFTPSSSAWDARRCGTTFWPTWQSARGSRPRSCS
jgi:mandelate racemase